MTQIEKFEEADARRMALTWNCGTLALLSTF
jgi:hypothetical protein